MTLSRFIPCCALIFVLSACGGGGGDSVARVDIEEIGTADGTDIGDVVVIISDADIGGTVNSLLPVEYVTPVGVEQCSVEDINRRVEFDMRDYYIYSDQVPQVNVTDYSSPESLIRDLRIDPDIYSFVGDAVAQSDLITQGRTGGFGFWFLPAADGLVRFRDILGGSPADQAGILRGDELVELNGRSILDITTDALRVELDPDNAPVSMLIRTADQEPRTVLVDFDDFRWVTAGPPTVYTNTDAGLPTVGYLPIRSFLATTEAEIDDSLSRLARSGGFDELIVDLRYNPGGLIRVAQHIASIVGGAAVANEVFFIQQWNDKYANNGTTRFFNESENPLNLPRVFVLVTGFSSSSSEIFINTLEPYIDVVVIGGVTDGKPFTSNAREYCGKAINAMQTLRTNAVGVSVAGGIQPDCVIADNWEAPASQIQDPLIAGALDYLTLNGCPVMVADRPAVRSASRQGPAYRAPEPLVPDY